MSDRIVYLAGLFDGEGTFSIQVQVRAGANERQCVVFNPRMTMTLKHGPEVLDELVNEFGGTVYHYTDNPAKIEHKWNLSQRDRLVAAATALQPHLRIKRGICDRFLEALAIFPESRKAHRNGERSWTLDMVLDVADIAVSLNPTRTAKYGREILETLDLIYT